MRRLVVICEQLSFSRHNVPPLVPPLLVEIFSLTSKKKAISRGGEGRRGAVVDFFGECCGLSAVLLYGRLVGGVSCKLNPSGAECFAKITPRAHTDTIANSIFLWYIHTFLKSGQLYYTDCPSREPRGSNLTHIIDCV